MKLKLLKENGRKKAAEVNFVFEFVATRVSESKLMVEYLHGQAKIISFLCGIKRRREIRFYKRCSDAFAHLTEETFIKYSMKKETYI